LSAGSERQGQWLFNIPPPHAPLALNSIPSTATIRLPLLIVPLPILIFLTPLLTVNMPPKATKPSAGSGASAGSAQDALAVFAPIRRLRKDLKAMEDDYKGIEQVWEENEGARWRWAHDEDEIGAYRVSTIRSLYFFHLHCLGRCCQVLAQVSRPGQRLRHRQDRLSWQELSPAVAARHGAPESADTPETAELTFAFQDHAQRHLLPATETAPTVNNTRHGILYDLPNDHPWMVAIKPLLAPAPSGRSAASGRSANSGRTRPSSSRARRTSPLTPLPGEEDEEDEEEEEDEIKEEEEEEGSQTRAGHGGGGDYEIAQTGLVSSGIGGPPEPADTDLLVQNLAEPGIEHTTGKAGPPPADHDAVGFLIRVSLHCVYCSTFTNMDSSVDTVRRRSSCASRPAARRPLRAGPVGTRGLGATRLSKVSCSAFGSGGADLPYRRPLWQQEDRPDDCLFEG
jgi:hypothetical protein